MDPYSVIQLHFYAAATGYKFISLCGPLRLGASHPNRFSQAFYNLDFYVGTKQHPTNANIDVMHDGIRVEPFCQPPSSMRVG